MVALSRASPTSIGTSPETGAAAASVTATVFAAVVSSGGRGAGSGTPAGALGDCGSAVGKPASAATGVAGVSGRVLAPLDIGPTSFTVTSAAGGSATAIGS